MKLNKMISVIDTHTAGEAARLVTAGIPKIPGKDMVEKKQYFIDHLDDVRKSVMFDTKICSEHSYYLQQKRKLILD